MTDSAAPKRVYPYITSRQWAELRAKFQQTLPGKVTSTYLQSVFNFAEKAARNLLPQLRLVGLIDSGGVPTDLARSFRLDSDYADAANSIVQTIYPDELRDLFPGPTEDVMPVAQWFMRHTGGGQASAVMQARFYLLLTSGRLPALEKTAAARNPKATKATKATTSSAPSRVRELAEAVPTDREETPEAPSSTVSPSTQMPGLHLDIQIHIDAAATADQIDQVFASMAKHLYGRG
jgi:hypothetical protein